MWWHMLPTSVALAAQLLGFLPSALMNTSSLWCAVCGVSSLLWRADVSCLLLLLIVCQSKSKLSYMYHCPLVIEKVYLQSHCDTCREVWVYIHDTTCIMWSGLLCKGMHWFGNHELCQCADVRYRDSWIVNTGTFSVVWHVVVRRWYCWVATIWRRNRFWATEGELSMLPVYISLATDARYVPPHHIMPCQMGSCGVIMP